MSNNRCLPAKTGIPADKVIAIGFSMPGLTDSVGGVNYTYLRFGDKTLLENLENRFSKKIFLENDARAMTLAEFKFATDHNYKNVLGLFIGWGIGLGIIIDGKLYQEHQVLRVSSHTPLSLSQET